MSKRAFQQSELDSADGPPSKRLKTPIDRLSVLSDELILRILDHASVSTLALCARVSQRLKNLSNDSQVWRTKYYGRFLRPRWRRRADHVSYGTVATPNPPQPERLARWLDEDRLVQFGSATDWKRQYKIRDNWSRGLCHLREIPLADPPIPSLLARLHAGVIVTADKSSGLRAWSYCSDRNLIATQSFICPAAPTVLAVDSSSPPELPTSIAIGFEDGSLELCSFDRKSHCFSSQAHLRPIIDDRIIGIALAEDYLVVLTHTQRLMLYSVANQTPTLLNSLTSHSMRSPCSLDLRLQSERLLVSIAFALPTLSAGWSTGVQEVHFTPDGSLMNSRLANSGEPPAVSLDSRMPFSGQAQELSKPTSLSYSHPYLLLSHADNTLTLFLVTSKADEISISTGKRLWGHTSSVLSTQVGGRGKAISVSSHGDEVRVWELESATLAKNRSRGTDGYSIAIRPERSGISTDMTTHSRRPANEAVSALVLEQLKKELSITKSWVGFDEERVVVVREQEAARQALAVYDFT